MHIVRRYSNQADHLLRSLDRCFPENPVRVERPPRPAARLLSDKLSESDQATIVQAYRAGGISLAALAEQFSVSDYSIRKVLPRAGIGPKRGSVSGDALAQIRKAWDSGVSVLKIVEQTDVPEATVRLIVASFPQPQR